jgi:O-antigen/teichoic acid export membrane protein
VLVSPLIYYLLYVICIYLVILGGVLALSLADPRLVLLVWAVVLMEHLGNESYQLLISRTKPIWANVLHFIRGGLWALLYIPCAYALPALRNIEVLLTFWFVGAAVAFLGVGIVLRDWPWLQSRVRFREGAISTFKAMRESRPLYISTVCETISVHSDRFIVTAILGVEATGIYVFFLQIGSALANLHYSGVVQMSRPAFVRTAAENPMQLPSLLWSTSRVAALSTVFFSGATLIAMPYLLPLIGREALSAWYVVFYFVLVNFNLNVFAELQKQVIYSLHADRIIMRNALLIALISLGVNIVLLHFFGLLGAGGALVCISIIRNTIQLCWLRFNKHVGTEEL